MQSGEGGHVEYLGENGVGAMEEAGCGVWFRSLYNFGPFLYILSFHSVHVSYHLIPFDIQISLARMGRLF